MHRFNNILLFGGETKNENMPVGFYSSLAMLPLRGKPVIWWQLNNLKNLGMEDFIVIVCKNNEKLINYIKDVLKENFKIKLVLVNNKKNILSSLKYGLHRANMEIPTRVILGDTLITQSINDDVDILLTSKNITSSENWCLVRNKKNNTLEFFDKEKHIDTSDKAALVGYYAFKDTKYLLDCCTKARLMLKKEISTALMMYQKKYTFKTKLINDWYDLGHTAGIIKAKNILFNARCFNAIAVNTKYGTLTKSSTKIQKLEDEAFWFNNLPDELKILTPRFINFQKDTQTANLTQELYGYPSLQELYLSGNVNIEDWNYIIEKLFETHKLFEKYTIKPNPESLLWLYYDKTVERLSELKQQGEYWEKLLAKNFEYINGKKYNGIAKLKEWIKEFAKELSQNGSQTIIHGDYCFSNILFDSSNYIFKFIDPRGRLNAEATIYGDPRYDIAKLQHSVCGLYDFIVQGLFKVSEKEEGFEYKILTTSDYSVLETIFNNTAKKYNFNPIEIEFIEGLLFLSMIPLHRDNLNRQKMFYIRAIELLNRALDDKEKVDGRKEVANMY